jgi:taurine dioxygenase
MASHNGPTSGTSGGEPPARGTPAPATLAVAPVTPLTGAEVTGADLSGPLPKEQVEEIRALLARHKVLFFREAEVGTERCLAFARQFGAVLRFRSVRAEHPDYPGVHLVPPAGEKRRPDGGRATGFWHIDATSLVTPPFASILRAVTVPPVGGDTIWANFAAAYEGLPFDLKETAGSLIVTHHAPDRRDSAADDQPQVSWPLVRVHPETGEKYLHINFMLRPRIIGWDRDESEELVRTLKEETTRPEYEVRFRWTPGAVAMWDNRMTHHYGVADYGDFPRQMERILIADLDRTTTAVEFILWACHSAGGDGSRHPP